MILNLINWIWILFSVHTIGYGIFKLTGNMIGNDCNTVDMRIVIGTIAVTVYAEFFSLFGGVGLASTAILFAVSVVIIFTCRKDFVKGIRGLKNSIPVSRIYISFLFIIVFLIAASLQPFAYDDYLYHIQAIEWINRYGVIPGQGILHCRFGYNSAYLSLQALYNWEFLNGYALHGVNAFFAMLMSVYCICSFGITSKDGRSFYTGDVLKVFAILYMLIKYSTFIGVETDQLVCLCFFYVFIKWFEGYESGNNNTHFKAILSLIAIYSITLKLSVAPIALLAFFTVYLFTRERKYLPVLVYGILCFVIVLPFLIRGVLISGYLLYPSTIFNIFNVDWKIPADLANEDLWTISIWGKHTQEYLSLDMSYKEVYDLPLSVWIRKWLGSLNSSERLLFFVWLFALIDWIFTEIRGFIRKKPDILCSIPLTVIGICSLYWFIMAPEIRFGGFLMPVFVLSFLTLKHKDDWEWLIKVGVLLCLIIFVDKARSEAFAINEGYIHPMAYQTNDMQPTYTGHFDKMGNEIIFYAPVEGEFCGPETFPASCKQRYVNHTAFRGEYLEDGFIYTE